MRVRLKTRLAEIDQLATAVGTGRGRVVTIHRDALANLLADHAAMVGKLAEGGVQAADDQDDTGARVRTRGAK